LDDLTDEDVYALRKYLVAIMDGRQPAADEL
jgi:hypothetical protein